MSLAHFHATTRAFIDGLDQGESIQAEYVWIGGSGEDLRSKTKTVYGIVTKPSDLPNWNYDGSSTGQASGHESEVILKPRAIFKDPFRKGKNILVMCDTYDPKTDKPLPSNTRYAAAEIMKRAADHHPWFGIEQEYTIFNNKHHILGWPAEGFPAPQGPYYCGVGADRLFGRDIAEAHYRACLYAGIKVSGINSEVLPGQWEFQIGPCEGIEAGDELWMARYIMHRVGELYNVVISLDPKPVNGDWNGSGCHTNYSTESMRRVGGFDKIVEAIEKLAPKHKEHIAVYGKGNERRLLGSHETASIHQFSYGVANRGASIRIPNQAKIDGMGYFEDRRPASNMDPYLVTAKIVDTTILDGKVTQEGLIPSTSDLH